MKMRWAAVLLVIGVLLTGTGALADGLTPNAGWVTDAGFVLEAETPVWGSPEDKLHNLMLAAERLDGATIRYGEKFSFNETVGPRTREAGYLSAINGRGVEALGGGVSQLATTLYLAVKDSGYFTLDPYSTYGERFAEWYVESGSDAIITDYKAGTDFSFTSWYDGVIRISAWVDEDYVYCSLEFGDGAQWYDSVAAASAATPLYGSENKRNNIRLASDAISGIVFEWGESFSFNDTVGPRSQAAGFTSALNGRGVKVNGGGVAQVASTIYLAAREMDNVSIDPVRTYGENFVDGYVDDPDDAIVTDYGAGVDLSFTYWGNGMLTVLVFEEDDWLICEFYED